MKRAAAIARREMSSYFFSPIAYVAQAIFLLASAVSFWDDFVPGQPAEMRHIFQWMVWLMVVIVPILSMGLMSQEKATGTIESLMTAPVGETDVILGKFFGSLAFFGVLLAPTLLFAIMLTLYGHTDKGAIACGYLGIILVGALFISVGLFCSSLTKSQVVAAVAAAAALFLVTIVPWWVAGKATLSPFWRTVADQCVLRRYEDFSKGILDSGNVVFFIASTAVFLFFSVKVLEIEALGMNDAQFQRWVKYGGNVLLSSIVVVALAVLVTYAAQRKPHRLDTTAEGLYSLKPQTLKILADLKKPIKLVSLYTMSKPPPTPEQADQQSAPIVDQPQAAQTVNDLLEEYATANKNITLETIDPVTSPTKVDDLIEQVEAKYGGEVAKYKSYVDAFPATITKINEIAAPEVKAVDDLLPKIDNPNPELVATLREVILTVDQFPKSLGELQDAVQRSLKSKPPDYKGATDGITEGMTSLSTVLDAVINNFGVLQKRGGLPPAVDEYMKQSLPHYQAIKKIVDDSLAAGKQLGELKLDTLRSALRERNSILVMGDTEWRAISFDQVWQPAARTSMGAISDEKPKPRFAGEQQVTSAILQLASGGKKPKVAFVRPGGSPLTQAISFAGGEPPFAEAAARLGLYNYDVVEKDLTGQFAAQNQGMGPPEPSDDEIKNATWVVFALKGQQSQFGQSPSIAPQVAEHIKQGGSAVIITGWGQDPMTEALADLGVEANTSQIIVHEKIPSAGGNSSDMLQDALRMPFIFDLHEYGDHPLARPLSSLEGLFLNMCPVKIHGVKNVAAAQLLPIPTSPSAPHSWASASFQPTDQNVAAVFDPAADTDGPVFAGAAVERTDGARVVVLGSVQFATNSLLDFTESATDPNAPPVIKFPANGELFTNSVFWASHQDTLIDISPAAMDVGRIRAMSNTALGVWRIGVLLIGLPGLVLLTGFGVYLQRRD